MGTSYHRFNPISKIKTSFRNINLLHDYRSVLNQKVFEFSKLSDKWITETSFLLKGILDKET